MPIKKNQIEAAADVLQSSSKPSTGPNKGAFFTKLIDGVVEGFYVDNDGTETQITSHGVILGGGGGGSVLSVKSEGSLLSAAVTELNFEGAGISTSLSSVGKILVSVAGGSGLLLGETSLTAYRGDRGKLAYDHSLVLHAPSDAQKNSNILKSEIEAVLTGEISSHTHAGSGGGEINTAANLAGDQGLFAQKSGVELQFKSLIAGTNVSLTGDASSVTINATGGSGEVNTASNLGITGEGVFYQKSGVDLQFKKVKAGTNVTLSSDTESITINAASSGTSDEYIIKLGPGVNLADRIADLYTSLPSGWIAQDASTAAIVGCHTGATDLAITHNQSKLPVAITFWQMKDAGPVGVQRFDFTQYDADAEIKSSIALNAFTIADIVGRTDSTMKLVIFLKLIGI